MKTLPIYKSYHRPNLLIHLNIPFFILKQKQILKTEHRNNRIPQLLPLPRWNCFLVLTNQQTKCYMNQNVKWENEDLDHLIKIITDSPLILRVVNG